MEPGGGLIRIFARHPTAAHLLMALMILAGVFALTRLNIQFFPDFGIDLVSIDIEWPGAGAEDIDTNIVQAVEPEVRFIDGVKRVRSTSVEGRATITVEFEAGTDMQAALSNVETSVGQVTTLPEDSERPEIRRAVRYDSISRLVVSGPYPEASLKALAKRIRDALLDRGIQKVDMFGARDEEIWVEVRPEALLRLDLKLADIAQRIRETSQDLPSGTTRGAAERQIRSLGLVKEAQGLGHIEVKALKGGEKIYLRDIARVDEGFDEDGKTAKRLGKPAIELHIRRALSADALEQAAIVDSYLAELRPTLPPNLKVEQYLTASDLIKGRIDLLLRNGLGGLVLVVLVLFVFLRARVAFWVAVGIPISLFATLAVMLVSGQSINMISLFGLIMAIGMVVDEAIVVGEHAEARRRAGLEALAAAEGGARRMAAPVMSSALTTIAAFTPLLLISDIIGEIIAAIPFVVIAMIVGSLIECFLVLPAHLRGALRPMETQASGLRDWFDTRFDRFRKGFFRRSVEIAVRWRYVTVAVAFGAFILSVGLVLGGRVAFNFFPSPESDTVYANVRMVAGTPRKQTAAMLDELERALVLAERRLTGGAGGLVRMSLAKLGTGVGRQGGIQIGGDNVGGVVLELTPSDERAVRTAEVVVAWRQAVRPVAGLETMTIVPVQAGPPGREVDVRLAGGDPEGLKKAAREVRALLARYPGVSDIEDDLPFGKGETILKLTPRGRALGFTTQSVGRQVRNAFEGAIAKRFARGDEEVLVRVRLPRAEVDTAALGDLYLRSPIGAEVPVSEVVVATYKQGFASIKREDGARQVAITAEIDKAVTTNDKVLDALGRDGLAEIAARHGLSFEFAGRAEEQARTLNDMKIGAVVGLIAIYIILAWVFASFTQPLVVMSIIPLGLVGAILGHWAMGFDLSILSLIALVGLSGIVVNDSIILVTTIDDRVREGEALESAIVNGTRDRLRAVILTSATTIGGLTPLMFERSLQAQFLIPMAVTIVFGLMVTTFLVLIVVPALLAIKGDVSRWFARWWPGERAAAPATETG